MTIHTPKYQPGQIVYVLYYKNEDNNPTLVERKIDEWDFNFAKIFRVEVVCVSITKTNIEYTVSYPNDTDNEWNESIDEQMISDDKYILINKLIEKWQL